MTLSQIYQGMRGMTGLVSETSLLDAQEGIRFRGYSIPELQEKLPKAPKGHRAVAGRVVSSDVAGRIAQTRMMYMTSRANWQRRSHVPNHVFAAIEALPVATHPMTQFVVAIMALQTESQFAKRYADGMNKKDYWDAVFDDSMDLIARLPRVAAYIYRRKYKEEDHIHPNGLLDWAGNFAHMLGYEDETFKELMRLYMTIHADHEGGNVSAHTTHLVGSALSDPYLACSRHEWTGRAFAWSRQPGSDQMDPGNARGIKNRTAHQGTDRRLCAKNIERRKSSAGLWACCFA